MRGEVLHPYLEKDLPRMCGHARISAAFTSSKAGCRAIGVKIHLTQPERGTPHWESAWDWVADHTDIRVVVLTRNDKLAQLASWKIAEQCKRWRSQEGIPRPKVTITKDELRWFTEMHRRLSQVRIHQLSGHQRIEVAYERLCTEWATTVAAIQAFVGVTPIALEQITTKLETRPLSEVIANYQELVA
jgi:LPS sulfotransferase NodH